jgi:hypothetical protein
MSDPVSGTRPSLELPETAESSPELYDSSVSWAICKFFFSLRSYSKDAMLYLLVTATENSIEVPKLSDLTEILPPRASTRAFDVDKPTPIPDVSPFSYLRPDFMIEKVSKSPD